MIELGWFLAKYIMLPIVAIHLIYLFWDVRERGIHND